MMRLNEFNKPDYKNMSDKDLDIRIQESLNKIEELLDKSNRRIENELQYTNSKNIREISSN